LDSGTDCIVNAANARGVMGAGVAGAIRNAGGYEIQNEARGVCRKDKNKISDGSCYRTGSGLLSDRGIKAIYHAVTMKEPGGMASLHSVSLAMEQVILSAIADGMESIAIPGLGIGIGRLEKSSVARIMVKVARRYIDQITIVFVDLNKDFVVEIEKCLKVGDSDERIRESDISIEQGLAGDPD